MNRRTFNRSALGALGALLVPSAASAGGLAPRVGEAPAKNAKLHVEVSESDGKTELRVFVENTGKDELMVDANSVYAQAELVDAAHTRHELTMPPPQGFITRMGPQRQWMPVAANTKQLVGTKPIDWAAADHPEKMVGTLEIELQVSTMAGQLKTERTLVVGGDPQV